MELLLDTSVLIDTLRLRHGRKELLAELVEDGNRLATTAINIAEIYSGVRAGEEDRTIQLLESLECYAIDAAVGEHAGRLRNFWARRGHAIALPDMFVAAVAIEQGCALLTDNRKHFPMPELKLYPLP
ncbi:MAG: VapC toxin family PIN domain ribonuclease [Acidobacteria bacterium]|nr:MAG: VapC toxin family PIN domain ribonuclease [Acidobacteriota bacterium]